MKQPFGLLYFYHCLPTHHYIWHTYDTVGCVYYICLCLLKNYQNSNRAYSKLCTPTIYGYVHLLFSLHIESHEKSEFTFIIIATVQKLCGITLGKPACKAKGKHGHAAIVKFLKITMHCTNNFNKKYPCSHNLNS